MCEEEGHLCDPSRYDKLQMKEAIWLQRFEQTNLDEGLSYALISGNAFCELTDKAVHEIDLPIALTNQ